MQYKKSFSLYLLIVCVIIQAISGLLGGYALLSDPTGEYVGLPAFWLQRTPFQNYLIPGIILLTILGIFPILVFAGLIIRSRWALISARLLGYALIIWIATEIYFIGYQTEPPLQLIYGLLGVIILLLAYSSRVTNYYL